MIAANLVVAFLAPFSTVFAEFAFDPMRPIALSAVTCLFLHDPSNIFHLLGNLVFLAAVGPLVESEAGPFKFAVVYLVSGLAGVATHWAIVAASGVGTPLIGASASIAGCVGYCTVRYARRDVPLAPKIRLNVGAVALVWIVMQAVGAFVKFGDSGGTSYLAHIGGFLAGVLLAFLLKAQVVASAEAGREHVEEMSDRSPAAALAAVEKMLEKHPSDPVFLWEKAAALHALGEREREAEVLATLVRSGSDVPRAIDCLVVINKVRELSAVERMRLATSLEGPLRINVLRSVAAEQDVEPQRPYALVELIEIEQGDDRDALVRELLAKYEFHAATESARAKGLLQ